MAIMQRFTFALVVGFVLFVACQYQYQVSAEDGNRHTTIVLCGATGDLATRYLWQSIFNVYSNKKFAFVQENNVDRQSSNHSFSFIGVARSDREIGIALLDSKLQDNLECDVGFVERLSPADCVNRKRSFINSVEYVQVLNEPQDFITLCKQIQKGIFKTDLDAKVEVIMYMAIPPNAYVSFIKDFKKTCLNNLLQSDKVHIRWALEKPFGVDKMSAQTFADKLETYFGEKESYHHVDHYLQKSTVRTMLPFRFLNTDLEKVWNKDNIERVEIFLKESLDVKDRISFYNSVGVLRDIHQNHLTELLVLVAMELPLDVRDSEEISERKADLLRQVESVKTQSSLFGQYADYVKHASLQMSNDTKTADVPTFAAVLVKINSARWRGVPFLLVSGKQLDRRESFVRAVFKDTAICVSGCQTELSTREPQPQVVFQIGHGDLSRRAILVSKSFNKPVWPDNIDGDHLSLDVFKTETVHQTPVSQFFTGVVVNDVPAYQSVVGDLVDGIGNSFVTTPRLLLSWRIWDSIVTANKTPRAYEQGDPHRALNFRFDVNSLEFVHSYMDKRKAESKYASITTEYASANIKDLDASPAVFLGRKLVTASSSLLPSLLAKAVAEGAEEKVKNKGVFHIALSGGSSISPVLHSLVHGSLSLPWDDIHVWQVDERCVPHHHENSNFGLLDRELFRHVNIPFSNIHALPVDIGGELCDESLGGAHLYAESIKNLVQNAQFDMVILGLGTDGHTAGLFPGSTALHVDSETFVTISDDGPKDTKRRMSLTLPVINLSKQIAVLVTGPRKRDILQQLELSNSLDNYPILGIHPSNGTVSWYIDDLALSLDH